MQFRLQNLKWSYFPDHKWVIPAFSLLLLFGFGACSEKKNDPAKMKRDRVVPVVVSAVEERTVPVQLAAIGNVEAFATVAIKSRITGELKEVHFREGQDVAQGSLLFTIDPDPFVAELKKAQANLARNMALVQKAEEDQKRYSELVKSDYISREQYEQSVTNVEALKAQIKADQAAVDTARLQVNYCSMRAPITGRTGTLLADRGNMIKANDDNKNMVVINQIQPIYVAFSLPEQNLADLKKYSAAGTLKLKALIAKDEAHPEEGRITFIDNTVDRATGTIRLKGTFLNKDRKLWPGQFVNVVLDLTIQTNALVVPSQALQIGIEGQYVFIINPDMKAEVRPVTAGRSLNGLVVIEKGLKAGERVVVDGQFQLVSGTKVQIKSGTEGKGPARS
jgi:membrane fusion protein, multidrug efflux system